MTFNGDTTQRMPESIQKEVMIALQAEAALDSQIDRTIRNYLVDKGIILPGAPIDAYEEAKERLDPELLARIKNNTRKLSFDLFLKMAEQQYELDTLKHKNTLTGLANRKMADKTFELFREHLKAGEEQNPMAVVNLDLDGFKIINDTYGHDVGNEVLKLVGKKLKSIRATDLAIHFQGDEFGLILTGLRPANGLTISETVEKIISKIISTIEDAKEITLLDDRTIPLSLSASAGFKILTSDSTDDFFATNAQAEEAMELSKKCKGVEDLKFGSSRVVDSDKSKEEFLKEKGVPLEIYEESAQARNFGRPADELLTLTAKSRDKIVTPKMRSDAQAIMKTAAKQIRDLV